MALTKSYTDPKGPSSPNAYAVVTHERVRYCERTAEFTVRIYHSKGHRDFCEANFIREIPLKFSDYERFGLLGGQAGRVREAEVDGDSIEMAAAAGIETHRRRSTKGEDGNIVETTVETESWPAELEAWKLAHPTYTDLFGPGTNPDRRKTLYVFLSTLSEFSDWSSA